MKIKIYRNMNTIDYLLNLIATVGHYINVDKRSHSNKFSAYNNMTGVEWCVSGAKLGFFMLYAQIDYKFVKVHKKPNIYIIWSTLFFLSPGRCTHVRTS